MHRSRKAFSILEVAVVIAMCVVICALLLPSLAQIRSYNRKTVCMQNLKVFGNGSAAYENQYAQRIPTFSWRADIPTNPAPGSPVLLDSQPVNDYYAALQQARDLIWRRMSPHWDIADQGSWFPHILYSHLVLLDYLNFPMLGQRHVCPEDINIPRWQQQYQQFVTLNPPPTPPVQYGSYGREPFMSNYTMSAACWAADGGTNSVYQSSSHNYWVLPNAPGVMNRRRVNEVVYPSQKVYMYDNHARHMGARWYFYAWVNARQPLLFFDGAVRERRTGDGNRGFNPSAPASLGWTILNYSPTAPPNNWESPDLNGGWTAQNYNGAYFRFTRAGLRGRDFDGPEVPY